MSTYLENGCPNPLPTHTGLSYLDTHGLTEDEKDSLRGKQMDDTYDMAIRFQTVLSNIVDSFEQQRIEVKKVVFELMCLDALEPGLKDHHIPTLSHYREELSNATNFNEVFQAIRDNVSFLNYEIISHIIEKFGNSADTQELRNYETHFEAYCRQKTFECPPNTFGPVRNNKNVCLVIKTAGDLNNFTHNQAILFQRKLSKILKLTKYPLRLADVNDGCIQLTFAIPACLEEHVFPLSDSQKNELRDIGVESLVCGEVCAQAHEYQLLY